MSLLKNNSKTKRCEQTIHDWKKLIHENTLNFVSTQSRIVFIYDEKSEWKKIKMRNQSITLSYNN